jgi:hypothetical protein
MAPSRIAIHKTLLDLLVQSHGRSVEMFYDAVPLPECFCYKTEEMNFDSFDVNDQDVTSTLNDAGQLMVTGDNFISMGIGEDGLSGLLNEGE